MPRKCPQCSSEEDAIYVEPVALAYMDGEEVAQWVLCCPICTLEFNTLDSSWFITDGEIPDWEDSQFHLGIPELPAPKETETETDSDSDDSDHDAGESHSDQQTTDTDDEDDDNLPAAD